MGFHPLLDVIALVGVTILGGDGISHEFAVEARVAQLFYGRKLLAGQRARIAAHQEAWDRSTSRLRCRLRQHRAVRQI